MSETAVIGRDSHTRTLVKTLSWRILATLTTMAVAYLVVGEIGTALIIGGIEFVVKMFIYYLHERGWQMVHWGTFR